MCVYCESFNLMNMDKITFNTYLTYVTSTYSPPHLA